MFSKKTFFFEKESFALHNMYLTTFWDDIIATKTEKMQLNSICFVFSFYHHF